jgi:hypothetical protein
MKKSIIKYSGKVIGSFYRNKNKVVFIKNVIPKKHILRQGNAYGIQFMYL